MTKMKCLKKYIKEHGKHFTTKLAMEVIHFKWSPEEVMDASQKMVYYNVTDSTQGDMAYLANYIYSCYEGHRSKSKCISEMLSIIGNVFLEGQAFLSWLHGLSEENKGFDFSRFI